MKRRAAVLAMTLCVGLVSPVIAEDSQDEIMQELEPVDEVAGAVELEGEEVLLNELRAVPDVCSFCVKSAEFLEEVQAEEAAEDSVKIKASKGNLCLDVKLVERGDSSCSLAPIFEVSLNVGGNTDYKGRVMIEAERNDGFWSGHNNPSCTDGRYRYYLVNTADSTIRRDERDYRYFLYDYVVQVPEEIVSDQTPVYVLITVGDSQFYYQVK